MIALTILPTLLACVGLSIAQSETAPPPGDTYGGNSLAVIKDSDVVSQAFPEIDIELLSPYFLNPGRRNAGFVNGTQGPTSLTELDYFVRSIADRNDWITYRPAEFQSEEGRPLPYVYLSAPAQDTASVGIASANASSDSCHFHAGVEHCTPGNDDSSTSDNKKLKVYIQAAIHGNEPAADEGALALLGKMDANQTWTASLLEKMDILILPRWNVDGVAYFQRRMACNLDPNREAVKLDREQTRNIWRRTHEYAAHIMIDMHEYTASTTFGEDAEYQHAVDAMLGIGADLNIHPNIRDQALNTFIPAIGEKLDQYGLRHDFYVTAPANTTPPVFTQSGTGARFAESAVGLTQAVSFLFETRGIRLADQNFQRRVATQLLKLEAVLERARDDTENLYALIEGAREDFITSTDDIVITDATTTINRTYPLVSVTNGSVVEVPVTFIETPTVANLTRSRPEGYLIPKTWSDIAAKLKILGLEIQTLEYEYRGTVEALTVTSSTIDPTLYEGHVLNTVTTDASQKQVHLPAGSFYVSTRQKNAALAFAVLEPESLDSYVTFNFVPVDANDEYPIYRVLAS
ncbi:Carboxypeptidase 2 [Pseudocercospora fuligena]|uniref:Carboxypeptidase 2 n=1 Tax=Pseudocercospora fuligena TaxID=685502 RepID=A0A8H6VNL8_9PEZI|nr:Carboxypeptidase 2 [Pseudocercospora fuligena]